MHTFSTHITNLSQHEVHLNTHTAGGNKTGSFKYKLNTVAMEKLEVLHTLSVYL